MKAMESPTLQVGVPIAMDLRVATNGPPTSGERYVYSLGDNLRVRRRCCWHHGIYVGADRVVQFGGVLFDKPHSGIEEVALREFHRGDRVEVVPKQQKWLGLWDLPPALQPDEIVRRARWLAERRFAVSTSLITAGDVRPGW
ncbi:MAG: lecithin retinol acyltransferase family protein [Solirubrobacteraceae bacterium]